MTEKVQMQVEGRTVHIVAQRQYRCCECGGHIEKLDVYQHVTGKWEGDGRARYFRTCGHCDEIRDWLFNETDFPGAGGVAGSFVFRGLRQHLMDLSRTGDKAFRIPAMRRVVQMNRRRTASRLAKSVAILETEGPKS